MEEILMIFTRLDLIDDSSFNIAIIVDIVIHDFDLAR